MAASKESRLERLALAVALGEPVTKAAERLDIPVRSAMRYASESSFKARVDELRRATVDEAVGRLSNAATEAVDTLRSLLAVGNPPSVRCMAARSILEKLIDVQTHAELNERVAALE